MKTKKKEIYTYKAPWTVYAMAWSNCKLFSTSQFCLAIGSYIEKYCNSVQIVKRGNNDDSDKDDMKNNLCKVAEFDHPYPCTKILWSPDSMNSGDREILATTGDYLRLWNITDEIPKKMALLNNNKNNEYCAPLTSFDWNESDFNLIGTSSIDTTCSIWDISSEKLRTKIIAHEREVLDLAFTSGKDIFASVGADGTVRMFDLRSLDHSTIIYESPNLVPLLRLEWNKQDPNYLTTFTVYSQKTVILDVRFPSIAVTELGGHTGFINATAWAPHSSYHVCTAGDDSQALIWDLSAVQNRSMKDPILAYNADREINNLKWCISQPEWISIAFSENVQILRV